MITLYHFHGSTCSQKVRLVLAEKGLDYESREVNLLAGGQHDPDYVKLNPNHVVPTLVHDGGVFIESTLINEYLDDAFPETPLRPASAAGRHAMRLWTQRIDALHQHAGVLTYAIGTRPMLLQRSPDEIDAQVQQIPEDSRAGIRPAGTDFLLGTPQFRIFREKKGTGRAKNQFCAHPRPPRMYHSRPAGKPAGIELRRSRFVNKIKPPGAPP